MSKRSNIQKVFRRLRIRPSDYPLYVNPEQFARGIRKFSLLKSHDTRYSTSTVVLKEK